ncbi:MAG: STAS domain-containing protein, partial [Clostridia bacterium]|nr:STAS domain-containing protein [Clostridia bacterium]
MQINKTTQNNEILLSVSGRIDSTNAQELIEACAQVEFDKIEKLVMDFADVAYISSAGLRSLL